MPKVTTKRHAEGYQVHFDSKPTRFLIVKDDPPKWGMPQGWLLTTTDDPYFVRCEGRSKTQLAETIQAILDEAA